MHELFVIKILNNTTVLNVSHDRQAVLCESDYASEQQKHNLKYPKNTDITHCELTVP
jgi:hypothetical protein